MQTAPTSGAHGSAVGDIPANATSFARHLRAANKSPMTTKSYLEGTRPGRLLATDRPGR
jgi:hypothetical protein